MHQYSILRNSLCAFLLVFSSNIATADANSRNTIEFAKKFSHVLADRGGINESGNGILLLWLSSNQERYAGVISTAELTPAIGGKPIQIKTQIGAASVAELPAGRYCLSAVSVGEKKFSSKCEIPYLDVSANSVAVSGQVEINLGFPKRLRIIDRKVDSTLFNMPISADSLSQLDGFIKDQETSSRITLFGSGPSESPFILRLLPDGTAEVENFSLANSSYWRGTWQNSERYEVTVFNGNGKYLIDKPGTGNNSILLRGLSEKTNKQNFEFKEQLSFSSDVSCWGWNSCGKHFEPGIIREADFNFHNSKIRLSGELEISYKLKMPGAIALPINVKLINHTMPRELALDLAKRFEETVFLSSDEELGKTKRCRIKFESIGTRARAIYSEIP